jgi:hypothetical protein
MTQTVLWKLAIKDLKLTDLDLDDQNHTYNEADITASETLIDSRDYVYPVINYGDWRDGGTVQVEDRFPAVRIKRLLNQIFNDQGYKVESTFIDSDFGKKLFIPFTKKKTSSSNTFADDKLFRVGQGFSQFLDSSNSVQLLDVTDEISAGFFDDNNLVDLGSDVYEVAADSVQNVTATVRITATGGNIELEVQRLSPAAFGWSQIASTSFSPQSIDPAFATVETGFIAVESGDKFRIRMIITGNDFSGSSPAAATIDQGVFLNDVSLELAKGAAVSLQAQLPEWFQLDLIQALKTTFNLYFYTDVETRTVIIEPFDDFFQDDSVDWSDKLDLNTQRNFKYIGANQSKTIIFDYTDDSNDKPVEQILDTDLEFAQHDSISTNVFSRDGQSNVTSAFAPTLMATASTIGFVESLIPKMWNETPLNELPDKCRNHSECNR